MPLQEGEENEKKRRITRVSNSYNSFMIGSKWKLLYYQKLIKSTLSLNELQKSLEGISQKVLTTSLRELADDGIIYRKDYHTNPPRVEYGMSDLGKELINVLKSMEEFGYYYKARLQILTKG